MGSNVVVQVIAAVLALALYFLPSDSRGSAQAL